MKIQISFKNLEELEANQKSGLTHHWAIKKMTIA